MPAVRIYSRRGCHLCDLAIDMLRRYGITPEVVDIDADASLRDRFGTLIPVVEIDGRERFRGKVDERLLRRLVRYRFGLPVRMPESQ